MKIADIQKISSKLLHENQSRDVHDIIDDVLCRYEDIIIVSKLNYEHIVSMDPSLYMFDMNSGLMVRATILKIFLGKKNDYIYVSYRTFKMDIKYMNCYEFYIRIKKGYSVDIILDYIKGLGDRYDISINKISIRATSDSLYTDKIVISY